MSGANSTLRAAELAALIARHSALPPNQIAAHVTHLQRIARQLQAIEQRACNGVETGNPEYPHRDRTPAEYNRDKAREKKLAIRAQACASNLAHRRGSMTVEVGGDPRGPCLRLLIEGERGDGLTVSLGGSGSYAIF